MSGPAAALLLAVVLGAPGIARAEGVDVGKPSAMRNLVPAKQVEGQAQQQYAQMLKQAADKGALAPEAHPQVQRLRAIARKLIPFAVRFNPRAKDWRWEINLIGSNSINAFCMPGGKIAFFSGILEQLQLTDDEVAMVMGHEIAHALREHARERIAKSVATDVGVNLLGMVIGDGRYTGAFRLGGNLLNLKFSRGDETEADLVGLELAARAGFDPRAGISLWRKMSSASKGGTLEFLSTHPSGESRIDEIGEQLPNVMPLYESARRH